MKQNEKNFYSIINLAVHKAYISQSPEYENTVSTDLPSGSVYFRIVILQAESARPQTTPSRAWRARIIII